MLHYFIQLKVIHLNRLGTAKDYNKSLKTLLGSLQIDIDHNLILFIVAIRDQAVGKEESHARRGGELIDGFQEKAEEEKGCRPDAEGLCQLPYQSDT